MDSEPILAEMLLDEDDLFRYCDLGEHLQGQMGAKKIFSHPYRN
jgi:hypothetical protein